MDRSRTYVRPARPLSQSAVTLLVTAFIAGSIAGGFGLACAAGRPAHLAVALSRSAAPARQVAPASARQVAPASARQEAPASARQEAPATTQPATLAPSVAPATATSCTITGVSPWAGLFPGKWPYQLTASVVVTWSGSVVPTVGASVWTAATPSRQVRVLAATAIDTSTCRARISWDGKNALGKAGPGGMYRLRVTAAEASAQAGARILAIGDIARRFTTWRARAHMTAIAALGVRRAGSVNESRAASYVFARFKSFGYRPRVLRFRLANGAVSRDVIAVMKGSSATAPIIIMGAHMDSIDNRGSRGPGANDDASGVGVVLETARALATIPSKYEIRFVAFGAEEMIDANPDHHHAGSRAYAKSLTAAERKRVAGMVNLDMVGVGSRFGIGTQSGAPTTFARYHIATAHMLGYKPALVGHGTGSDHEAFVRLGIRVAYYDWTPDPNYHSPSDLAKYVSNRDLLQTGQTVLASLFRMAAK
jgi:hypothetical protein